MNSTDSFPNYAKVKSKIDKLSVIKLLYIFYILSGSLILTDFALDLLKLLVLVLETLDKLLKFLVVIFEAGETGSLFFETDLKFPKIFDVFFIVVFWNEDYVLVLNIELSTGKELNVLLTSSAIL